MEKRWNLTYGDGNGVTTGPMEDLDWVSHEFTHAVTQYTAGLIYSNQPGALNESISDVFAMMIDTDDYWIGEDSKTPEIPGDAFRYMDNPPRGGQPNHMDDYVTLPENDDNGGVHINSGIPNFAAYLATAGGVGKYGNLVTGIGRDKVGKIWYRALSVYMTPSTDFQGARIATINAATDLYGASSSEVQTINDAWTAVGVIVPPSLMLGDGQVVASAKGLGHVLPAAPPAVPHETRLLVNYPNPSNPETFLPFELAEAANVQIQIYDASGRLVRELDLGHRPAGRYVDSDAAAYWDGRNSRGERVSSGVYLYRMTAGDFSAMRRLLLLK